MQGQGNDVATCTKVCLHKITYRAWKGSSTRCAHPIFCRDSSDVQVEEVEPLPIPITSHPLDGLGSGLCDGAH